MAAFDLRQLDPSGGQLEAEAALLAGPGALAFS
jgi:hypothetical protein